MITTAETNIKDMKWQIWKELGMEKFSEKSHLFSNLNDS